VEAREIVVEFWRRIEARDWDGLGLLLSEDFSVDWPDTRLRIRGRQNFVEFNRTYPEGWAIEVLAIIAAGDTVVSEVRGPTGNLASSTCSRFCTWMASTL
jgi:ketosteroid isomerase-like protein